MEWQPIETAPKDGTDILAFIPSEGIATAVHYRKHRDGDESGWFDLSVPGYGHIDDIEAYPTHWMPLPDAPK